MTIGLIMCVRNEKQRIEKCLKYHARYFDEIVVCDQMSDDGTYEILQAYQQASPVPFRLWQDFHWGYCEPSKQGSADLLDTDWLLYLDPDEKFPEDFLNVMHKIIEDPKYNGYNFPRYNIFEVKVYDDNVPIEPKWLLVMHPKKDPQLRLTKKSVSVFPKFLHHRVRIEGVAADLPYPIVHRKSINEQWQDNRRYAIINKK